MWSPPLRPIFFASSPHYDTLRFHTAVVIGTLRHGPSEISNETFERALTLFLPVVLCSAHLTCTLYLTASPRLQNYDTCSTPRSFFPLRFSFASSWVACMLFQKSAPLVRPQALLSLLNAPRSRQLAPKVGCKGARATLTEYRSAHGSPITQRLLHVIEKLAP